MRNLFIFIARYHAFFIFIFLEAVCVYLIYQNKSYHQSYFINSSNVVTGKVYSVYDNITGYFYLRDVNDSLMAENAKLQEQLSISVAIDTVESYMVTDSIRLPNDSLIHQIYKYIPAKVLNNSVHEVNNYLTLNRGSQHGISKGMGVIYNNKVVGKIVDVSENYSVVMSVLHQDSKISSKIMPGGARGILVWRSTNPTQASLDYVSQPAKITKGDTVMTTGASTIFPQNILIGRITDYSLRAGSNFYNVELELLTPFNSLQYVYVVSHLRKNELDKLEKAAKVDQ